MKEEKDIREIDKNWERFIDTDGITISKPGKKDQEEPKDKESDKFVKFDDPKNK